MFICHACNSSYNQVGQKELMNAFNWMRLTFIHKPEKDLI